VNGVAKQQSKSELLPHPRKEDMHQLEKRRKKPVDAIINIIV
jgi:hypothetical protein